MIPKSSAIVKVVIQYIFVRLLRDPFLLTTVFIIRSNKLNSDDFSVIVVTFFICWRLKNLHSFIEYYHVLCSFSLLLITHLLSIINVIQRKKTCMTWLFFHINNERFSSTLLVLIILSGRKQSSLYLIHE